LSSTNGPMLTIPNPKRNPNNLSVSFNSYDINTKKYGTYTKTNTLSNGSGSWTAGLFTPNFMAILDGGTLVNDPDAVALDITSRYNSYMAKKPGEQTFHGVVPVNIDGYIRGVKYDFNDDCKTTIYINYIPKVRNKQLPTFISGGSSGSAIGTCKITGNTNLSPNIWSYAATIQSGDPQTGYTDTATTITLYNIYETGNLSGNTLVPLGTPPYISYRKENKVYVCDRTNDIICP
jgi:hypothetical protein